MVGNPGSCSLPNGIGQKTEISEEQGSQVASSLKQRGKIQIGCLCRFSLIVLSRKRPFIQRSAFYERNQEPTEAALYVSNPVIHISLVNVT